MHLTWNECIFRWTALLVNWDERSFLSGSWVSQVESCLSVFSHSFRCTLSEMWWVIRQRADKAVTLPHQPKTFSGVLENIWLSLLFKKQANYGLSQTTSDKDPWVGVKPLNKADCGEWKSLRHRGKITRDFKTVKCKIYIKYSS